MISLLVSTIHVLVYETRVESLASSVNMHSSVKFHSLKHAIHKVQAASAKLDVEKVEAEEDFKDKFSKLPRPGPLPHSCILRWLKKLLHHCLGISDPIKEFIKAAKRVQATNAKLVAFEKGFLHEDGIKDREWYRHLGVAPGKWLGMSFSFFQVSRSIVDMS